MRFPFGMAYFQGLLLLVSGRVGVFVSIFRSKSTQTYCMSSGIPKKLLQSGKKKTRNFSRGSLLSFMIHRCDLAGPNVLVCISTVRWHKTWYVFGVKKKIWNFTFTTQGCQMKRVRWKFEGAQSFQMILFKKIPLECFEAIRNSMQWGLMFETNTSSI